MSVAIVGLACAYPDALDPGALWETVVWQRRAFRPLPVERLDPAGSHSPDRPAAGRAYGARVALIEGWEFDPAGFGVSGSGRLTADPAHRLALDTAARALADAGFPGGQGLDRDRVAVVVGTTLASEAARVAPLRPHLRRVLASVLADLSEETAARLMAQAEAEHPRPFPDTPDEPPAAGPPCTIATRICRHFDLRGGGHTVDGACASSLLAVIDACRSLLDGSADFALAGGVDLGLGRFEPAGAGKGGAPAGERMRVYDVRSDGSWPGEGCGMVVLARTADARAAGLRIHAEITGWGVSCDGSWEVPRREADGRLLALRRAYARAGVSPAEVALFEGAGAGTADGDVAELTALTRLLSDAERQATAGSGAPRRAAAGSVDANIGYTGAAAGVAGLIKATLSVASGVLPPTTGCGFPHHLLTAPGAPLRVLAAPEPWPAGPRHAGVSAMGPGGVNAHLVLTASDLTASDLAASDLAASDPARADAHADVHEDGGPATRANTNADGGPAAHADTHADGGPDVCADARPAARGAAPAGRVIDRPSLEEPLVFAFSGRDVRAVRPVLERVADQATRWSEAELCDLAYTLGTVPSGPVRIAIVAGSAEQLAERAGLALERRGSRKPGMPACLPGIHPGSGAGKGTASSPAEELTADTSPAEAAALWAAGTVPDLTALYGDRPARPIDIWRDRVFVPDPFSSAPYGDAPGGSEEDGDGEDGDGEAGRDRADAGPVAGVARWVRCFAEDPKEARVPSAPAGKDRPGTRPPTAEGQTPSRQVVIDDPLRPGAVETLVAAVREAIADREGLAVLCESDALTGFLATLRLEHPGLDLAAERPGGSVPLSLDGEGPLPVGAEDVVLVSGDGTGIGFACAMALAEIGGCGLALLGRERPGDDTTLRSGLKELTRRGIRHGHATAEMTDADAVARAVRDLENALGPVTMVIHSASTGRPVRFADLAAGDTENTGNTGDVEDAESAERYAASELAVLDNLLAATTPRRVVTFGSVSGRYGQAGRSRQALAGGLLRERVRRIGGLNIDWPAYAGAGSRRRSAAGSATGSTARADLAAVTPQEAAELFLKLLRTGDLPSSVAVHGRLGDPPAPCPGGGHFLDEVRVHVPGVELVADSRLSLKSDGYLDDHRIDGAAVLPAVVALEAMAQAAGILAGRPLDEAGQMTFDRPVVVPDDGGTTIRVCALRHDKAVEAVVRSEETGFRVDHFRAVFPVDPAAETLAVPQLNRDGTEPLDAGDLYGALCFHTGRFQRVRELTLVEARGCRGELHGDDPDGWFEGRPVLGSPGLSDATIHALQACVPHRRLLPVGGERLVVRPSQGDVRLHATERHHSEGEYVWDVTATDVRGRLVAAWTGLRLRDVGPLPRRDPWPPNLLAVYLQRASVALGLDPALHVTMDGGTCHSRLGDLVLGVDGPAYCSWERVGAARGALEAAFASLIDELLPCCGEPEETVTTRIWTAVRCLSKAGRPPQTPLTVAGSHEDGWLLLRSGADLIASTVVRVRDVREPVAVSIMTGERR
ncbi:SDR family NAD(P)-dependent oxidoreductase [Streptosporangium sp. CA-135522]|uniref:SDR family NAD(P)-dependent oxidoreductase n=1 Tax=Streptosporangium sp. CA-135522 TaxID=3240072 RepID=UPI003D90316F